MDPCPFARVLVGNLALKLPASSTPVGAGADVHPSTTPCFCKIRLNDLPYQTALLPLDSSSSAPIAAAFHLSAADIARLLSSRRRPLFSPARWRIKISIYTGRRGCGLHSGRLLGKVSVPLDLNGAASRPAVFYNGWVDAAVGKGSPQLHVTVRSEPDPRFVFEFGGEPECSPQVFQLQGSMRQPVFTCKFSCRTPANNLQSRSGPGLASCSLRGWLSQFGSEWERRAVNERKGWSVTVHDLSGSPVALASIVTPFVASAGAGRVSRSNPGAWLVLRPGDGTWKPWGRLEAWRERGGSSSDGLGYRFELLPDTHMTSGGISLAESTLSTSKGGKFTIDLTGSEAFGGSGRSSAAPSPGCSPRGSGDFRYGLWPFSCYRGFVMSSTVEGEGRCSRPMVEVGVQHVGCAEDAAAFVALAAAMDLSMDACRLFSHRLRKELSQHEC